MNYPRIKAEAAARGLVVLGGFHPDTADAVPHGTQTLILLGPDPMTFWPTLQSAPEATEPDPIDTWSRRVIGTWACDLKAKALFPFGTPVHPFFTWATRTGRCHASPIQLLVHDTLGLMVSFRGALALKDRIDLPAAPASPCDRCPDTPCLSTCPASALSQTCYDLAACHAHLSTQDNTCMTQGCAARHACPASPARPHAQSAHHMAYFHR